MYLTECVLLVSNLHKKNFILVELKSKNLARFNVQYLNCNILSSFCVLRVLVELLLYFPCASKIPVCLFYITKM